MQTEPTLSANLAIGRQALIKRVVVGTFLGLAWGAGLRAWMAVFAITASGSSSFTWSGTFLSVLLPTTVVGAALGWAEHARRTGGRGWRWTALAPLLFVLVPAVVQEDFVEQLKRGLGTGAIGIMLIGMIGGYAISGRGPKWASLAARITITLLAAAILVGAFIAVFNQRSSSAAPVGAYMLLTFLVFSGLLAVACAIPHLPAQQAIAASNSRPQLVRHSHGGIT